MAISKLNLFPEDQVALAGFAAALAHPARIAIIGLLQANKEASCGEIVHALPLAQATVSQHLQALNKVGLLRQRECGAKICYSINCEALRNFCHSFQCTLGTADSPATESATTAATA